MKNLILISGTSGAGKTTASTILEDLGYTCIDQYPTELFPDLIKLIETSDSIKYSKVALTISLLDLERFYSSLSNSDLKTKLIILDSDKDTIINRYKFTRRMHPLVLANTCATLEEAIDIEKNIIKKYKDSAFLIDTSNLTKKQHKEKLDKILNVESIENIVITFESFGFKYGVPDDADLVFDVRMLDNPYYVNKLKKKTGNDKAVRDYVLNSKLTEKYLKKLISYIDFTLKAYNHEEKRHLCICVGCTGGQHRSVTVANYLYNNYKDKYMCYIKHRELNK